jgi:transposase
MVKIGPLSPERRRALMVMRRRAVGRVALRAQMVLWSAQGMSARRIAELLEVGEDVVRTWLRQYRERGPDGLADRPRPGRPPKDHLARPIVDTQASNPPCNSGLVQTCWTVGLLAAFLAARFRLALSGSTVRRALRAAGWRWARPRLAPASVLPQKRDPDTDAKVAAIAAAARAAARGAAHLLYLDECDLHLLPALRACWMKGPRLRVPTPGTNAKRAFFGALDAVSGVFHSADHDRKLAVHFVAFLQQLAEAYPTGRLILALDNVRTHDAKVVRVWRAANPRVECLWLPKYAAHDANPAERIWGLLKDAVAANRLAGSIGVLTATARRWLAMLKPHPVPPSFITAASW